MTSVNSLKHRDCFGILKGAACVGLLGLTGLALAGEAPEPEASVQEKEAEAPKPAVTAPVQPQEPTRPSPVVHPPTRPPMPMQPARPHGPAQNAPGGAPPQMTDAVRDQTDPNYLVDLAQVHLRYRANERALPLFEKALEHAEQDDLKARIHNQLGTFYQQQENWAAAAHQYEGAMALKGSPDQKANTALTLSSLYEKLGDFKKAEALLTDLRGATGDQEDRSDWIGCTALQRLTRLWNLQPGRVDEVIAAAESALEKNPNDEEMLERLAEIHSSIRPDPKKAIVLYEKLRALHPDDLRIRQWLANQYQQTGEPEKAIGIYQDLLKNATAATKLHYAYQIAQLMLQAGKKEEALAYVQTNLADNASDPAHFSLLASFYERAGAPEKAESAIEKALAQSKNEVQRASLLLRLAHSLRVRKDFAKAEVHIREAMELNKNNPGMASPARNALIQLYKDQGRMDELKMDQPSTSK